MSLILREEPPVEVPLDVPHREFFVEMLKGPRPKPTKRPRRQVSPVEEWRIPSLPSEWVWQCFFVAARTMVGRHTPLLLELWDLRAAQMRWEESEVAEEEARIIGEAFKDLLTIMVRPEAAKIGLKGIPLVALFEGVKAAFAHCKALRRRHGSQAKYEPMPHRFMYVPVPAKPLRTDSLEFYRLALSQVFGTGFYKSDLRFLMEWFSADRISDRVLQTCLPLWEKPSEAALTLLAGLTNNSPEYLAQAISQQRVARRHTRKQGTTASG